VARPPGERITVGLVRGLHGLRGAVRVEVLSDDPARFSVGSVLHLEGEDRPLTIVWTGPAKPGLLVRFRELPTRESVEPLRERYLEAVPEAPLPAGTWYWHEIIGLEASTTEGEILGSVSDVFRAGGGEVYVVTGGPRGEVLVPAVKDVVVELVPEEGRLVVDSTVLGLGAAPTAAD
jgi:16S rRNA processing protein RimM